MLPHARKHRSLCLSFSLSKIVVKNTCLKFQSVSGQNYIIHVDRHLTASLWRPHCIGRLYLNLKMFHSFNLTPNGAVGLGSRMHAEESPMGFSAQNAELKCRPSRCGYLQSP